MHTKQQLSFFFFLSSSAYLVSRLITIQFFSLERKTLKTLFCPGYYVTRSLELLATLESHNASSMFAGECIRATNRWTVTLSLKRFKGSKRVKGKEEGEGGVRMVTMVTMTSLEACALCLNGSFGCVEVKANNSPETTEGGTL